jgi:caffeoyl-CoA O-methyltransferase
MNPTRGGLPKKTQRMNHSGIQSDAMKTLTKSWMTGLAAVVIFSATNAVGQAGGAGQPAGAAGLSKPPLPKDDAEKKILAVIDEMTRDQTQRYLSVSPDDGRLMRQLTEAVGAKRVVEVGTSTGYSGLWFALALRSTGGKLLTHELDPGRARQARENFKKAGVEDLVTVIEGDAHETVKQHKEPIDILFLDADKEGYIDYLEKLLPLIRPGGLIMAHNMRSPRPDPRYIEAITTNPDLDTSFLLMEGSGMGVTLKKR